MAASDRPLRLAFVLKSSDLGGTQKYVLELCRRLDRARYEIEVVTSGGGLLIPELEKHGIPVHNVEIPRYGIAGLPEAKALAALTRLFRERQYDIVHPQNAKPGFLGRVAAKRARVPVIVFTYHLIPFHEGVGAAKRLIYRAADKWLAKHATTHMIAVAHHHRNNLLKQRVCRPDEIEVIWNGLEAPASPPDEAAQRAAKVGRLGCDPARPVVAYIARLMPQKDPLTFVRTVARCHALGSHAQYLLIGDGKLRAQSEALAAELGLTPEKLRFVGERADVLQLLPGVDLCVLPSLWEGLPFALLEAMAAAVPCVASNIPGNDEAIVHEQTGLLVPPRDADAFAGAILELERDPARAREMGLAGFERLRQHFSLDVMVQRTAEVYERLWRMHTSGSAAIPAGATG